MDFKERGARCSSVVRVFAHGAMGRQIDPSWGGPIELVFHDWYMLSCLWDGVYKISLKVSSSSPSGPLPCVQCHIPMC